MELCEYENEGILIEKLNFIDNQTLLVKMKSFSELKRIRFRFLGSFHCATCRNSFAVGRRESFAESKIWFNSFAAKNHCEFYSRRRIKRWSKNWIFTSARTKTNFIRSIETTNSRSRFNITPDAFLIVPSVFLRKTATLCPTASLICWKTVRTNWFVFFSTGKHFRAKKIQRHSFNFKFELPLKKTLGIVWPSALSTEFVERRKRKCFFQLFRFQNSLQILMERMCASRPVFMRCLKPNQEKKSDLFDERFVRAQLRYCGMLETTRIRKQGFSVRLTFEEFLHRFVAKKFFRDEKKRSRFLLATQFWANGKLRILWPNRVDRFWSTQI